jgi:hypothetical protein
LAQFNKKKKKLVCLLLNITRGVSRYGLAIYIKKYLEAKEELYRSSNISPCKNIIFKKSSKKKPK